MKLDAKIKLRIRDINNSLDDIRQEIAVKINKEYQESTKAYNEERENLYKQQKEFVESISKLFKAKQITIRTVIKVTIQIGQNGGDTLKTFHGTVTKIYDTYKPCFNLSDKNYLDGKEFTIGSSCIQEIEILD